MPPSRLCFAGTPEFAASHLSCLIEDGQEIVGVYTQPDRPAGRGKRLQASPVKRLAEQHGLSVFQPPSLRNEEAQQQFRSLKPDLLIVVAYGLILPQEILDIPVFGCINVHASLLPRWRGAAPIERAILAGDEVTGVTIMQMDAGLDTGPMLYKGNVEITALDDRETLTAKLALAGREALLATLRDFEKLSASAEEQDGSLSTYAAKLEKHEALLDWSASAEQLDRVVRAGVGRFPAFTFIGKQRIRIIKAEVHITDRKMPPGTIIQTDTNGSLVACGENTLLIQSVQLPGKNPCSIKDLLNANSTLLASGNRFGNSESE